MFISQMYNVSTDTNWEYSQIKCRKDCYTEFTIKECGCKDFYFEPEQEEDVPYCNLLQSLNCLKRAKGDVRERWEVSVCLSSQSVKRTFYNWWFPVKVLTKNKSNRVRTTDAFWLTARVYTCLWIIFQMAYFLITNAILFDFGTFLRNSTRVWQTDGPTDGRMDGRTDGQMDGQTEGHTL